MEKKQIILPTKRYFKAEEQDLTVRVGLDETDTLLRQGDKDIVLDIAQLFDKERNESIKYKIYGKLKMVFRNLYEGTTEYAPLQRNLFYSNYGVHENIETPDYTGYIPYNEFAFLRRDVLREVIQMNSGTTLDNEITYTPSLLGTTYTGHTITSAMDAPYKNWNVYLSYVYTHDSEYPMKYTLSGETVFSFTAKDGIPFRVSDNGNYYTLTSPVEHGMISGEYITFSTTSGTFYKLSGGTPTISSDVIDRTFNIESVGNETHRSEKFVVNILKTDLVVGTTFNSVIFGKRCLDITNITGTTSQYYVHKHKTLTSTKDYILDKVGFESPIWEEEKGIMSETSEGDIDYIVEQNRMESVLFDFKEPFNLSGITNNLGYTPTEVYVSVIFRNGNGFFNYPPKVGYKFNFHDTWVDMHFSGSTSIENSIPTITFTSNSSESFTGGTDIQIGTILTGAFVEYNESELKERIISESYHKFTHRKDIFNHGQSDTLPTGLFYQPHYRVKLRQLSPYIETSNTDEILNLPENTKYFEEDGVWRWRDLYDHGYVDPDGFGTEHPFINGIHYVKNDINFYLRNEELYKNKVDGITKFKDKNTTDC